MVDFLSNIVSVLPEYQQSAISSLIARKKATNELVSFRSLNNEAERILNSIRGSLGSVILKPRVAAAGEKISSISHNNNMSEIFLDLNSLYSGIDQLGKLARVQYVTLVSEYQKSKAAVEKLINDVKTFSLRKKHLDFNEIKYLDFNASSNSSKVTPIAEVNPETRLLKSKIVASNKLHVQNRNNRITNVYTKTISSGIRSSLVKNFDPLQMIDQRPETFWATMVLSDSPVYQKYTVNSRSGESTRLDVYGPVVEIFFKFSHIERLNTIRILPFSEFPIKILDISYRPSIDSAIFYTIPKFSQITSSDWEEYRFETIYSSEIKITISQENYKQNIYQIPKSTIRNIDIFQRIYDSKISSLIGSQIIDSDQAKDLVNITSNYEDALDLLDNVFNSSSLLNTKKSSLENYYSFNTLISSVLTSIDPEVKLSSLFPKNQTDIESGQDLVEVRKFEYILGMREVELEFNLYAPESFYESEKMDVQATISEIQLEVEEDHLNTITSFEDNYHKTSVEWTIDIGGGRIIPIHPRNIIHKDDQVPTVKDEYLRFEGLSGSSTTRLGGLFSNIYGLKKDGYIIPENQYTVSRTTGVIPKLKIDLTGSNWYDPASTYTVDYAVDPGSYRIQVIDRYDSEALPSPDIFTSNGSDNEVNLSKFPFINYEVVNLTGYFSIDSSNDWIFNPPQANVTSGQLYIFPQILDNVGNILQTGSTQIIAVTGRWGLQSGITPVVLQGNSNLSSVYFGDIDGVPFGYYLQLMDSRTLYEVSGFISATGLRTFSPIEVTLSQLQAWDSIANGIVFSGFLTGNVSGWLTADYSLGIGVKTDDEVFALSQNTYSPITVTIGGKKAKNITNYSTFQHPAFSLTSTKGSEYQYIHAGKTIYFNQPITNKEIKADYKWLTDYISVKAVLRNNQKINTDQSPTINSILLLINNMII